MRGSRPMMAWLHTDLPEPDSPTRASVPPGGIENETLSTARRCLRERRTRRSGSRRAADPSYRLLPDLPPQIPIALRLARVASLSVKPVSLRRRAARSTTSWKPSSEESILTVRAAGRAHGELHPAVGAVALGREIAELQPVEPVPFDDACRPGRRHRACPAPARSACMMAQRGAHKEQGEQHEARRQDQRQPAVDLEQRAAAAPHSSDARRGANVVGPQRLARIAQIGRTQPRLAPPMTNSAANSSCAGAMRRPGIVGALSHNDLRKSHAPPSIAR